MSNKRGSLVSDTRMLAPICNSVAQEEDVVARCARAFAEAFDRNPAAPRLGDVAREARCSRNTVKNHLAEAQRRGLLSLKIRLPKQEQLSLALAQKFDLAEAVVTLSKAKKWEDQSSIRSVLAPEVVRYFERFSQRFAEQAGENVAARIGVDGGMTIYEAIRESGPLSLPVLKYELFPLVFGPLVGSRFTASNVAYVLASKLESAGTEVSILDEFAIEIVWDNRKSTAEQIMFSVTKKRKLPELHLLLVGIGSCQAGLLQRELDESGRREPRHFGDILNLAFDRQGDGLASIERSRAVLLSLNDLKARSRRSLVVGAAGGKQKVEAIATALRTGFVSVIITDPTTAEKLLRT